MPFEKTRNFTQSYPSQATMKNKNNLFICFTFFNLSSEIFVFLPVDSLTEYQTRSMNI